MKHLFVTDMDGTLLDNHSMVSRRTSSIISSLSASGVLITVATARTPATVEPLLADTRTILPAIVMTGAALWDRASQSFLDPTLLSPFTAADIRRICRLEGIEPFRYQLSECSSKLEVFHAPTLNQAEKLFYDQRQHLRLKRFHLTTEQDSDLPGRTILLFATGPADRIAAAARHLEGRTDCAVSCYPDIYLPDTGILEVMAPGISKADAVIRLADRVGADRLTVFGDNLNDLPMMEVADVAVAVQNALPQVRERADIVIGPNTDDSVPLYISGVVSHNGIHAPSGLASRISQTAI